MTRRASQTADHAFIDTRVTADAATGDVGGPAWLDPAGPTKLNGHAPAASVDQALVHLRAAIRAHFQRADADDPLHKWRGLEPEHRERLVDDAVDQVIHTGARAHELDFPGIATLLAEAVAHGAPATIAGGDRASGEVDDRPSPRPRSEADPTIAMIDDWEIDGLLRRGRLFVVAGPEGLGKSVVRQEMAFRKATGHGALFNHYGISRPGTVLSFDVENGEEEEVRREEEALARLGLRRADLGDYWGVSLEGLSLTDPADQAYIAAAIEQAQPAVVMFDTGGSMVGDEWGKELKAAIRFLRGLARRFGCAVVVFVHVVKPAKAAPGAKARGKPEPNSQHGTSLYDVMGQWTRQADTVALMADAGADRVLWTVRKRAPHSQLVLRREAGTFEAVQVVAGEDLGVGTMERIHGCIATGYADAGAIATYLELSERTVWRHVARLREAGRVEPEGALRIKVRVSASVSRPVSAAPRVNGTGVSHDVNRGLAAPRTDSVSVTSHAPLIEGAAVGVSVSGAGEPPEDLDVVDPDVDETVDLVSPFGQDHFRSFAFGGMA